MAKARWKIMRAICKSVGNGSTYFAACKAANITEMTLWRWRRIMKTKLGKSFDTLLQTIWDLRIGTVEDAHYISAIKGNPKAQENFLNNRARHRWRKDPDTVINVGDDNSKHVTQIFQTAPAKIMFDDGEGDRLSGLDDTPEDCQATPPETITAGEGTTECQENRLP